MQFPGRFAPEFLEAFAESASIQCVCRAFLSLMIVSLVRKNHLFKEISVRSPCPNGKLVAYGSTLYGTVPWYPTEASVPAPPYRFVAKAEGNGAEVKLVKIP